MLIIFRYLLAENHFTSIRILEQRSNVGGVWNYVPLSEPAASTAKEESSHPTPPPTPPNETKSSAISFPTPIYDRLETNVVRPLMGFSDLDWPADTPLFPSHQQVLAYLEVYAKQILHLVSLETQVVSVRTTADEHWSVRSLNLVTGSEMEEVFDAVVVASGHYDLPFVPSVPGMHDWEEKYPGSISHAKTFRAPDHFAGKKVVVVGNMASGSDIGAQIKEVCASPLIFSVKEPTTTVPTSPDAEVLEKPPITHFEPTTRTLTFADSTTVSGVDEVLYCTGYLYDYPFLPASVFNPSSDTTTPRKPTFQPPRLDHFLLPPTHPTLAFMQLTMKIIPFTFAETQASVISRLWSGRLSLPLPTPPPSYPAEDEKLEKRHMLTYPADADYINFTYDWVMSAEGEGGKTPPKWGERERWMRRECLAFKKAWQGLGERRFEVQTLEALGFMLE